MKGEMSKISLLKHFDFSLEKNHRNEKGYLMEFKLENIDIFSLFYIFNVIIRVLFSAKENLFMIPLFLAL